MFVVLPEGTSQRRRRKCRECCRCYLRQSFVGVLSPFKPRRHDHFSIFDSLLIREASFAAASALPLLRFRLWCSRFSHQQFGLSRLHSLNISVFCLSSPMFRSPKQISIRCHQRQYPFGTVRTGGTTLTSRRGGRPWPGHTMWCSRSWPRSRSTCSSAGWTPPA